MTSTKNPAPPAEPSPAAALLAGLEALQQPGPPNLGDVLTPSDVSTKGTGSYAADYVNWARVAHLLHLHAPGWQFHLTTAPDGAHVWAAPNGSAYMVGHFVGPDGQRTADFPQAVMDNRNAPKAMAAVSARDVTDTHRRCLCAAAAATFGLAWQLWAKESVEDPHHRDEAPAAQAPQGRPAARPAAPAGQHPRPQVSDDEITLRTARKRCLEAGLTADGAANAALELTQGESQTFSNIPIHLLRKLATTGASPETVARWNAGTAAPEPDDRPLADPAAVAALAGAA
jgi:hypothetical protein